MDAVVLLVALVVILAGAELFTNGVEWLGVRFNLSHGAVGSVLAAVGTALPETAIPVLALVRGPAGSGHDIGLGAILGAPFMLSTLALLVTGVAVVYHRWRRRRPDTVRVEAGVIGRDLGFFLVMYGGALLAAMAPAPVQAVAALALAGGYALYVYLSFARNGEEGNDELSPERLYLMPQAHRPHLPAIAAQIAAALTLIVGGAHYFVEALQDLATVLGVPPLVLSLILTPVATELPEKMNSVLWVGRGKDTLALGNITGAMVFQGSVLPALAVAFGQWRLGGSELATGLLALLSALILLLRVRAGGEFKPAWLLTGGAFYVAYVALVL